ARRPAAITETNDHGQHASHDGAPYQRLDILRHRSHRDPPSFSESDDSPSAPESGPAADEPAHNPRCDETGRSHARDQNTRTHLSPPQNRSAASLSSALHMAHRAAPSDVNPSSARAGSRR